jgi:hypothetical protein
MGFVQVIKLSTSEFDEVEAAHEEWRDATEGQRTVVAELICENRDVPGEYWMIVEFPSYEEAMRNSGLPATARISERMAAIADGPVEFVNLDVVRREG